MKTQQKLGCRPNRIVALHDFSSSSFKLKKQCLSGKVIFLLLLLFYFLFYFLLFFLGGGAITFLSCSPHVLFHKMSRNSILPPRYFEVHDTLWLGRDRRYIFWSFWYGVLYLPVIFLFSEKVLERGERIDVLVGKTEELDHCVSTKNFIILNIPELRP